MSHKVELVVDLLEQKEILVFCLFRAIAILLKLLEIQFLRTREQSVLLEVQKVRGVICDLSRIAAPLKALAISIVTVEVHSILVNPLGL